VPVFRTLVVAALVGAAVTAVGAVAPAAPALRCNGSARLCDLPLGEVAFATSHNSMSSSADNFLGPNQDKPITDQLRQGIRGFQIDAYAGVARRGRVYTDLP